MSTENMGRKTETTPFTKEQLNGFSKALLVELAFKMQEQLIEMNSMLAQLTERVNVLTQNRFGRHTEKSSEFPHQMEFCFNESEVTIRDATEEQLKEPTAGEAAPVQVKAYTRKPHAKGTREDIIKGIPVRDEDCRLTGDDLICECGGRFRQIGEPEVTQRLEFTPASFTVVNYHIYSYKCDNCDEIKHAPGPLILFEGSLATPSLLAGIMTAKFINAVTYFRLEKAFADADCFLRRQTMARWMIQAADMYFTLLYDRFKEDLLSYDVIHADETTVMVSKDGRPAGAKSYIWVYTKEGDEHPVVIFEYQKTRAGEHPREFLRDYHGYLCTDGYEAYHTLNPDIIVCGCWAHSRRHFSNAVKALQKTEDRRYELTVAQEALKRIGNLFHTDNEWNSLPVKEHLSKRQNELKKEVDAYFTWVQSKVGTVPPKSETGKGLTYSLNQRSYLENFLKDARVPLDNSEAERKIRNFVISRKNFVMIDTLDGAKASAVMFSIAETAKANNLKPYEYFKYLLEQIPRHMEDTDRTFLEDLLPWSEKLPPDIRKSR